MYVVIRLVARSTAILLVHMVIHQLHTNLVQILLIVYLHQYLNHSRNCSTYIDMHMVNKGNLTKHLCKHLLIVQCKCLNIHLVLCLKSQHIQFHEHHNFNTKYNLLIQKHHHQKDVCIHYLSLNLQNLRSKLNCF